MLPAAEGGAAYGLGAAAAPATAGGLPSGSAAAAAPGTGSLSLPSGGGGGGGGAAGSVAAAPVGGGGVSLAEEEGKLLLLQEKNLSPRRGRQLFRRRPRRSSRRRRWGKGATAEGAGGAGGARGKAANAEVPRGLLSLLVNILMFALQQFMLLYVIVTKTKSWLALLFLIWDVPLFLYMCYSIKADSRASPSVSSRRCAVQWMVYTTTVAVKMAVVAFSPGSRSQQSRAFLDYARAALEALQQQSGSGPSSNELLPHFLHRGGLDPALAGQVNLSLSNSSEFMGQLVQAGENADNFLVFVAICLLPVIYVIFTARAKALMYPTVNQLVSVEGLLHADLAFSMTLDMLDIVVMFRDSFGRFNSAWWLGTESVMKWICFAMVILTIVGVTCLGLAFPTRSAESRASVAASLSRTDMFISAKYAFLVGLFMVDIPYLALRIYWIVENDAISFFMFKNIYCLLTRPLRLNQCRLAEREKAKGTQKSFYDQDALPAEYRRTAAEEAEAALLATEEEEEEEEEEEAQEEVEQEEEEEDEAEEEARLRHRAGARDAAEEERRHHPHQRGDAARYGGAGRYFYHHEGGGRSSSAAVWSPSGAGEDVVGDRGGVGDDDAVGKFRRGERSRRAFGGDAEADIYAGRSAAASGQYRGKYETDEEYSFPRHRFQPRFASGYDALHTAAPAMESDEDTTHGDTAAAGWVSPGAAATAATAAAAVAPTSPTRLPPRFLSEAAHGTAVKPPSTDPSEASSDRDQAPGGRSVRGRAAARNFCQVQEGGVSGSCASDSAEDEDTQMSSLFFSALAGAGPPSENCSRSPTNKYELLQREQQHEERQLGHRQWEQEPETLTHRTLLPLHGITAPVEENSDGYGVMSFTAGVPSAAASPSVSPSAQAPGNRTRLFDAAARAERFAVPASAEGGRPAAAWRRGGGATVRRRLEDAARHGRFAGGGPLLQQQQHVGAAGRFISPSSSSCISADQQEEQPLLLQRFQPAAASCSSPREMIPTAEAYYHPSAMAATEQQQQQHAGGMQRFLLQSRGPGELGRPASAFASPAASACTPGGASETLWGGRPMEGSGEGVAAATLPASQQQQLSPPEPQPQQHPPRGGGKNAVWRRFSSLWVPRAVPAAAATGELSALSATGGEGATDVMAGAAAPGGPWTHFSRGNAARAPPAATGGTPGAAELAAAAARGEGTTGEEAPAGAEGIYGGFTAVRGGRLEGVVFSGGGAFPAASPPPPSAVAPPLQPVFGGGGAATPGGLTVGWMRPQGAFSAATTLPPAHLETAAHKAAGAAPAAGGGLRKRVSGAFYALHKKASGEPPALDATTPGGGGGGGPEPPFGISSSLPSAEGGGIGIVAVGSPRGGGGGATAGRGTGLQKTSVGASHQQQRGQGVSGATQREKMKKPRQKRKTCRERLKARRARNLLRDLNYVRGIPVRNIGIFACIWRFLRVLFHGGREGLRTMLDDVFVLPYLQQLRLLLSPVCYHAMTLGLFVLLLFCTPTTAEELPGIAAWPEFFPVTNWQQSERVDRTAVVLVCALALLQLLFYIFSAPFLDVLFVSIGASLRLLSSYLMLRAFSISFAQQLVPSSNLVVGLPTAEQQQLQQANGSRFVGIFVACVFIALPAYRLLTLSLPACFALCGKRYVSFKREKRKGTYDPVSCEEDPSLWTHARGLCGNRNLYTVSNAVLFFACRHCVAPLSINALLCGPDVFKDIRLLDNLAHAQVCDVVVLALLQFYALTMQLSWYMLGVFLGHDFFLIMYLVIGQTVRIMAQRRYEVKLLLQELVLQRNDGFRLPEEDDEDEESEYGGFETERKRAKKTIRFLTLADVEEEYQTEGYFSSPGCIFPQFL